MEALMKRFSIVAGLWGVILQAIHREIDVWFGGDDEWIATMDRWTAILAVVVMILTVGYIVVPALWVILCRTY